MMHKGLTSMTVLSKEYLNGVFSGAKAAGKATTLCVTKIMQIAVDWSDKAQVSAISLEVRLGWMANTINGTRDAALKIAEKNDYEEFSNNPARRTKDEQLVQDGAKKFFSRCSIEAGKPVKKIKRKTKMSKTSEPAESGNASTDFLTGKVTVGRVTSPEAIPQFALKMSGLIRGFENRNADQKFDDYRAVFDAFVDGVAKIAKK